VLNRFFDVLPNKSLDASGGSAFRNLIHPAMLDWIAPPRRLKRYVLHALKV